jgi:hypothetical protein
VGDETTICACGATTWILGRGWPDFGHDTDGCKIEGLGKVEAAEFKKPARDLLQGVGIAVQQKQHTEKLLATSNEMVETLRRLLQETNDAADRWRDATTALARVVGTGGLHG